MVFWKINTDKKTPHFTSYKLQAKANSKHKLEILSGRKSITIRQLPDVLHQTTKLYRI